MHPSRLTFFLGWGGLALCLIGAALVLFPGNLAGFGALDGSPPDGTIQLVKQEQRIDVPPDETYGIWVEDKDNSGYSIGCSITDERGKQILLKEPTGWTVGGETGWFDFEFNTKGGKLTVHDCTSSEAQFSVRPLENGSSSFPDFRWLVLPFLIGAALVQAGVAMLVAWAFVRLLGNPRKPRATA